MAEPTRAAAPKRSAFSIVSLVVGVIGLIAAGVMGAVLVTNDDDEDLSLETGDYVATSEGFVIEPDDRAGPDAFTAPVNTAADGACDPEALIAELESRPDAHREWAEVLGVPEEEVATYILALEPRVLGQNTAVTNHGLHDGQAYARPSELEAGTAVLVDANYPYTASMLPPDDVYVPPDESTSSSSETTSTLPTTTGPPEQPTTTGPPGEEQPVTRCKCGNPLLPAYQNEPPAPLETTTTTEIVPSDDTSPDEPSDDTSPDDTSPDEPSDNTTPDDTSPDEPSDDTSPDEPSDDTTPDDTSDDNVTPSYRPSAWIAGQRW
ncbi:MAG: hypothetical protein JJLCMIEE_03450 [Acidimicrobiales bacterium]|nr:hypothetical protein [Acidimicrobiales bacterium]